MHKTTNKPSCKRNPDNRYKDYKDNIYKKPSYRKQTVRLLHNIETLKPYRTNRPISIKQSVDAS